MATKDHIISEIRRLAAEQNGKAPGKALFAKRTGIKESAWSGHYWARWSDAIQEAGFEPNAMAEAYSDEVLARYLAEIIGVLGHWPTYPELRLHLRRQPGWPSHNTFTRLGRQSDQARVVLDNAEVLGLAPAVVAIALAKADSADPPEGVSPPIVAGFVYLLRSGRFFKIGRSNAPGRRAYEVDLVMPDKVRMIHEIATDDPPGIEAYWHQRFADRRRRGEWFDLTTDDIAAFKARKTM